MRVLLDGTEIGVPAAASLEELLGGVEPLIDPARLVTVLEVDGRSADATDSAALRAWRLDGAETVRIGTETPLEFASARRAEIAAHLGRIGETLEEAARQITGDDAAAARRLVARATRELRLVLELDDRIAVLDARGTVCGQVAETVRRIGPRLEDAARERRWEAVAGLLAEELVPALRPGASAP